MLAIVSLAIFAGGISYAGLTFGEKLYKARKNSVIKYAHVETVVNYGGQSPCLDRDREVRLSNIENGFKFEACVSEIKYKYADKDITRRIFP